MKLDFLAKEMEKLQMKPSSGVLILFLGGHICVVCEILVPKPGVRPWR